MLSCLHSSSSNSRIEIEQSNKSQTSSISQVQSIHPLISTEINTSSKVNLFFLSLDIQSTDSLVISISNKTSICFSV